MPEGAQRWAPWDALGTMPLRELLDLLGMLCLQYAEEFAAGPADLGPRFQVWKGCRVQAASLTGAPHSCLPSVQRVFFQSAGPSPA